MSVCGSSNVGRLRQWWAGSFMQSFRQNLKSPKSRWLLLDPLIHTLNLLCNWKKKLSNIGIHHILRLCRYKSISLDYLIHNCRGWLEDVRSCFLFDICKYLWCNGCPYFCWMAVVTFTKSERSLILINQTINHCKYAVNQSILTCKLVSN